MCGLDIDVPLYRSNSRLLVPRRCDRREDVLTRRDDVRLQDVASACEQRALR